MKSRGHDFHGNSIDNYWIGALHRKSNAAVTLVDTKLLISLGIPEAAEYFGRSAFGFRRESRGTTMLVGRLLGFQTGKSGPPLSISRIDSKNRRLLMRTLVAIDSLP